MKRLLLLVPTTSYRTDDFMAASTRLGVELLLGTDEKQALEDLSGGRIHGFDFDDIAAGTAQIVEFAKGKEIDAIVAVDDGANLLAAGAAKALGLRHNRPEAVTNARNKYRFRVHLSGAGCPSPDYRLLPLEANPSEIAREIAFPCVLKPLTLSMSRGVIRADGHNSFVAAFHRVADIIGETDAWTPDEAADHLLVESYIPGREYAVEGLIRDGELTILALFDKPDLLEGPYFEETIYVTPAPVSAATRAAIQRAAQDAVAAIGLVDGPTHIDLRVNDEGVYIIEVDARTIGGHCGRSLQFAGGIRLEEVVLRHALDLPLDVGENTEGAGGVMMIPIPKSGILRHVDGIDAASAVPLVADLSITIPLGHRVVTLPDGGRYLGFIIAHGPSADAVTRALRQAHELLTFEIDEDAGGA